MQHKWWNIDLISKIIWQLHRGWWLMLETCYARDNFEKFETGHWPIGHMKKSHQIMILPPSSSNCPYHKVTNITLVDMTRCVRTWEYWLVIFLSRIINCNKYFPWQFPNSSKALFPQINIIGLIKDEVALFCHTSLCIFPCYAGGYL